MRILSFVAPCLAIGRIGMSDSFTDGLFQNDPILPVRRQVSNSTSSIYQLVETYDATNFWDKFEFIEVQRFPCYEAIPAAQRTSYVSKLTSHADYADQRRSHPRFRFVPKPERS